LMAKVREQLEVGLDQGLLGFRHGIDLRQMDISRHDVNSRPHSCRYSISR
jgi:hypothetical protein